MQLNPQEIDLNCILNHIESYARFLPKSMRDEILSKVRELRRESIREAKEYVERITGRKLDIHGVLSDNALKPIIMQVINRCRKSEKAHSKTS